MMEKDDNNQNDKTDGKDGKTRTSVFTFNKQDYELKYVSKLSKRKRRALIRYAFYVVFVVGGYFGLTAFFNSRKIIEYSSPAPVVTVAKPVIMQIRKNISVNAYVQSDSMVPVVPFVSGTITEYPIKVGDAIMEGDLIAVIDEKPYKEQLAQAEAAYLGYLSTFERVEKLYNANAASQQDYDSVRAQKDAYEAQYNLANIQLGYTRVTAPVSGTILKAPVSKGSVGATTIPVAVIADLDELVVKANIPEKYFSLFIDRQKDIAADVIRPAARGINEEVVVPVKVRSVSPYVEAKAKTFEVTFDLSENSKLFRPGMFVKVNINYDMTEPVPAISQKAKKNDGSVYIYDENTLKVTWIDQINLSENEDYFEVPSQYRNSFFVISGQNKLFDDQEVNAFPEEASNNQANGGK